MEATNFVPRGMRITPARVTYQGMPARRRQVDLHSHDLVVALERDMLANGLPLFEPPVTNHFSHGVYGREVFIPAGCTLTGKIHKFSNMNILLEGEMLVLTPTGVRHVTAGYVEVAPPGSKRAGHALTDCRWLNVHGTHETDVDLIEAEFIAQTEQDYLTFCAEQLKLEK